MGEDRRAVKGPLTPVVNAVVSSRSHQSDFKYSPLLTDWQWDPWPLSRRLENQRPSEQAQRGEEIGSWARRWSCRLVHDVLPNGPSEAREAVLCVRLNAHRNCILGEMGGLAIIRRRQTRWTIPFHPDLPRGNVICPHPQLGAKDYHTRPVPSSFLCLPRRPVVSGDVVDGRSAGQTDGSGGRQGRVARERTGGGRWRIPVSKRS